MLFCGDSPHSAEIIHQSLSEFYALSGLAPNHAKSCIFLAGSNQPYKEMMLHLFQFPEGTLPVRYLGAPLITTKLSAADCKPLVDGITCRIQHWVSKLLSFAGRVQLIHSVLCSYQSFWNGLFILPKKVLKDVEQLLRRFLWKGPSLNTGGAKVAWEDVTLPLEEGGLGIKKLQDWNYAAMGKHLWQMCITSPTSNWALWARANLLRGRSLWEVHIPNDSSWTWRKILRLRPLFRPLIKHHVGDGCDTSLWFDNWMPMGPIHETMGDRVIYDSGLSRNSRVADIINMDVWHWPVANSNDLLILKEQT